jgi:ABC-2 type transport system permease protein
VPFGPPFAYQAEEYGDLVTATAPPFVNTGGAARRTVFSHTARRAVRSSVLWGYVFGAVVASSALSYTSIYKTQAERDRLAAAFGFNHAASALFGPAPQLQTVTGFTVFKSFLTLSILGAVWALLTSTRLLRGEEESGRWELLLTGQTTRRGATAQALGGMAAAVTTLWALASLVIVVTGRSSRVGIGVAPGLFFGVALVSSAVMFLAVGSLTSQLAATRRQAAAYAGWILGASYGLRLLADAGVGLHGLIWVSPLGWVEQLRPLTSPQPWPLVLVAAFTLTLAGAAVQLAGRRDAGASIWPDRPDAPAHVRLLSGPLGLAVRLARPALLGWVSAIAISGLLMGLVAEAAGTTIAGSSVQTVFSRLGAPGAGTDAFLGVAFLILAALVAFLAAGQAAATRQEEASDRLDHLLVRPVARWSWLGGRLLVAVAAVTTAAVLAGAATWLGTAAQSSGVSFATLLDAGINVVWPAVFVLGAGTFTLGLWPRATAAVVYAIVAWGLLVETVGGIGAVSHWILDTSVFHQMAASPAVAPNWATTGAMGLLGAALALTGGVAFQRRDVQGG